MVSSRLAAVTTTVTAGRDGEHRRRRRRQSEGEVNIIAWAGYIEDGSTDEAYDWVTQFEEETGCEVT